MNFELLDFASNRITFDVGDLDNIARMYITVISGDEVLTVIYKDYNVEIFDSSNDRLHYFFNDEYDIYNPDIDIDLLECRSFIERESSYWLVDFLGA